MGGGFLVVFESSVEFSDPDIPFYTLEALIFVTAAHFHPGLGFS